MIPITEERIESALASDECVGFCRACGADAYGVEPDARDYTCDACGADAVCGAEEFLF